MPDLLAKFASSIIKKDERSGNYAVFAFSTDEMPLATPAFLQFTTENSWNKVGVRYDPLTDKFIVIARFRGGTKVTVKHGKARVE